MAAYNRPPLPSDVARQLRQEAGFGCAKCGHPYLEYHHIIPFSQEAHFRCEDMVALCGNCHVAVGKMEPKNQYRFKHEPHNLKTGMMKGSLIADAKSTIFYAGSMSFSNVKSIISRDEDDILSYKIIDDCLYVTVLILNEQNKPLLKIIDNEIQFRVNDAWDFQHSTNKAIMRHKKRNIACNIDLSSARPYIEANLWVGNDKITINKNKFQFGDSIIKDINFMDWRSIVHYSSKKS